MEYVTQREISLNKLLVNSFAIICFRNVINTKNLLDYIFIYADRIISLNAIQSYHYRIRIDMQMLFSVISYKDRINL